MNQSLKEFKELRLIYSGRIDAAIKANDDDALYRSKVEYGNILGKYVSLACKIISNHTNKPFNIYKKTDKGIVYLSEKKVMNSIKDIRLSLKDVKLSENDINDIKTSLDIVTDYYEKVVTYNNAKYKKDTTCFRFQIIFGTLIAPITLFIASYICSYIISNWAINLKQITKLKDFYDVSIVDTKSAIFLLIIVIVAFLSLIFLINMFVKKSDESIWDKKKFMLIPIGIMKTYTIIMPIPYILRFIIGRRIMSDVWQTTNSLYLLIFTIFISVIAVFSLISDNFSDRGYKTKLKALDIMFVVCVIVTIVIPEIYVLIAQVFDLPIAKKMYFVDIMLLVLYLGYTLYFVNYEVFTRDRYKDKRIIAIIASIVSIILSIIMFK